MRLNRDEVGVGVPGVLIVPEVFIKDLGVFGVLMVFGVFGVTGSGFFSIFLFFSSCPK